MSDFIEKLGSLTDEEMASVARLIEKFASRKKSPTVDKGGDTLETERQVGRSTSRKKIVLDEREPIIENKRTGKGRTKPRESNGANTKKGKGRPSRTLPVTIGNANKFTQMSEFRASKEDVDVDKKLWTGREPKQRPDKFEPVEVQCDICKLYYDVNPSLLFRDPDTHELMYTCNNCVGKAKYNDDE